MSHFTIPSFAASSRSSKTIASAKLRQVWAYVSEHRSASVTEIAEHLCYSRSTVQLALVILEQMRYIEHKPLTCRARTIIIPFRFIDSTM